MQDEHGLWAGVRDTIAGVVLLAIGLATRTSSFDGLAGDALDHVFDTLAALWIVWGLRRIVRAAQIRAADRQP